MKIPVITPEFLKSAARVQQANQFPYIDKGEAIQTHADIIDALAGPVAEALDAVNGKATSFTICSPTDVRTYAREAEGLLETRGIPQALRVGTTVTVTPAGPAANAYKHAAVSTRITLERREKGAWRLINVERCDVWPRQTARQIVTISPAAAEAVQRAAMAPFTVRAAAEG